MCTFVGLISNNYITTHGMKNANKKKIVGVIHFFTVSGLRVYAHPVLAVRKNEKLCFRLVLWLNVAYLAM
jgi:hypothetical protein